ncbi:FecR family protein [Prevotella sp. 10(H)]|uniref:FecR family protein n=1 Tax=Prevotella sp. 10(H) TaxID=1158294 RepID=UPI0004A74204|nr:FecR family protein [Prevotella sp. 10(H)]
MQENTQIEEMLIRYYAGELDTENKKAVEEWIASSDENKKTAKQVYYICFATNALKTFTKIDVNQALTKVHKRMEESSNRKKISIWTYLQRFAAVLFIPLLCALAYTTLKLENEDLIYLETRTNPGMVSSLVLPDSTKVWLNANSRLRYPQRFTGNKRIVELVGEGYFEVKENKRSEFIVKAPSGVEIKVLGTKFNIEAYHEIDKISTSLLSGKVQMSYKDNNNDIKTILLDPHKKAVFDKNTMSAIMEDTFIEKDIAWKDGRIILYNTSLEESLWLLEKQFNVKFTIKNERLKKNRFTGTFTHQQLDQILKYFQISSNIRYKYIPQPQLPNKMQEKDKIEIY